MNESFDQITVDIGPECLAVNANEIRSKVLDSFVGQRKEICLDFTNTRYIDAAGVGVIASLIFAGRRKMHTFSMKGATGSVLDMLTATGLNRILALNADCGQS